MSETPNLDALQVYDPRKRIDCQKGKSRLELAAEEKKFTVVDEKAFRKAVIDRDGKVCRCCGRKVIATMARVPERLEVHHIHGRRGDLRYEPLAALVLCLTCHEKVTGRVNEKVVIVATKTFVMREREYTDARAPVIFKRAA